MRNALAFVLVTAVAATARAGKLFDPGAGLFDRPRQADCSKRVRTEQGIPAWSRLQWSVRSGVAIDVGTDADVRAVLLPQTSFALWARESQCQSGTGLFSDELWQRWSVSLSLDAAWQSAGPIDLRPALRLARSHYRRGFLSIGSEWLPSTELFVTVGPTFDARDRMWSGGAFGIGGRLSVLDLELRYAAHPGERDHELMVLIGITDFHGVMRLGPKRADAW
jgi:hypothetical protein